MGRLDDIQFFCSQNLNCRAIIWAGSLNTDLTTLIQTLKSLVKANNGFSCIFDQAMIILKVFWIRGYIINWSSIFFSMFIISLFIPLTESPSERKIFFEHSMQAYQYISCTIILDHSLFPKSIFHYYAESLPIFYYYAESLPNICLAQVWIVRFIFCEVICIFRM